MTLSAHGGKDDQIANCAKLLKYQVRMSFMDLVVII